MFFLRKAFYEEVCFETVALYDSIVCYYQLDKDEKSCDPPVFV